ncbi:MAG: TIGR02147 family protein [Chitinispirillaceae bacterium]|nr:TIGR02147 family protein [Chitinispirillaceae bacterium]
MVIIFDYLDYKKYLEDYYREKKDANPAFSYQALAQKAGFRNKGFIYNLINGKRSISRQNCVKVSRALGHSRTEAEYFENLLAFNHAAGLQKKNYFFERMSQIKKRGAGFTKAQLIRQDQYEFYLHWYHSAVRSLIDIHEFSDDYQWLARMVAPAITVRQARQSVELLEKLGMIAKGRNGVYRLIDKSITTGREVVGIALQNLHLNFTDLAKKAITEMPRETRYITGLTLGISRKAYDRICEETRRFQQVIMIGSRKIRSSPLSRETTPSCLTRSS